MQEELPAPPDPVGGLETALSNFETLGTPLLFVGLVAGIIIGYAIARLQYSKKK